MVSELMNALRVLCVHLSQSCRKSRFCFTAHCARTLLMDDLNQQWRRFGLRLNKHALTISSCRCLCSMKLWLENVVSNYLAAKDNGLLLHGQFFLIERY